MPSFKSFLQAVATDGKKVFSFFSSASGQKTVQAVEGVADAAVGIAAPALEPEVLKVQALVNTWIGNAVVAESVASQAASGAVTNNQKAAAVISSIQPTLTLLEQQVNAAPTTDAQLTAMNNAIVTFLQNLPVPNSALATKAPAA